MRGGHPEHREPGGGWGAGASRRGPEGGEVAGRVLQGTPGGAFGAGRRPGPRQEYVEAFDDDVFGKGFPGKGYSGNRYPGRDHPGGDYSGGDYSGDETTAGAADGAAAGTGAVRAPSPRQPDAAPVSAPPISEPLHVGRPLPDPGPPPVRRHEDRGPRTPGQWNGFDRAAAFPRTGSGEDGPRRRNMSEAGAGLAPGRAPERAPAGGEPPRAPAIRVAPSEKSPSNMGRAFTGVLAVAVTTVIAFVVATQITSGGTPGNDRADDDAGAGRGLAAEGPASRSDKGRGSPGETLVAPTYEEKLSKTYALDSDFKGKGDFETVSGTDDGAGGDDVMRYRVDVEKGLPLESGLFAKAVQRTLNDKRSWAHGGERSFERISKGKADFVVTLASSPTTDVWCAKSGLDTSEDKVSCDSASTDRIMINAYRWAQGSKTFGDDRMLAYRQMLINHEVGHRLGRDHVGCSKDGAIAPVMMQQTKSLTTDGAKCRPNPWPYPKS
ncbi:DUF3152 domain-containing protein [Streptomyces marispadix]|uniref:DUF3152 domain-containing protein n=1 Tax=Streptomyces marispadix TaxID=2922868 RepID=A0ABS9T1R0_9ACTN|nr:DUF3152 domain-containing protein [Streptomyces marispadix]MCH6162418.1 DUF3152 domain-containing protein [Streptomyces marispadix]